MALENAYDVGDVVRISAVFQVSSVDTDPTTVSFKVKDPTGTVNTYTYAGSQVTKDSAGHYHKDVTLSASGTWYYGTVGTGTCAANAEGKVFVSPSKVA